MIEVAEAVIEGVEVVDEAVPEEVVVVVEEGRVIVVEVAFEVVAAVHLEVLPAVCFLCCSHTSGADEFKGVTEVGVAVHREAAADSANPDWAAEKAPAPSRSNHTNTPESTSQKARSTSS